MRDSGLHRRLSSSVPLEIPCDSYQDVNNSVFTCYMRLPSFVTSRAFPSGTVLLGLGHGDIERQLHRVNH